MAETQPEFVRLALAKLDLPPDASFEEARTAHRELLQVWHPDRHSQNARLQARATSKAQELNSAWDTVRMWHQQRHQADAEGVARQRAEAARQARDVAERERRAKAEAEQETQARAEAERQRAEQRRQDQLRREREHSERVQRAWEQTERERIAGERAAAERQRPPEPERHQAEPPPSSNDGAGTRPGVASVGTIRRANPLAARLSGRHIAASGALILVFVGCLLGALHLLAAPEQNLTAQAGPESVVAPIAPAGPSISPPVDAAAVGLPAAPPEPEAAAPLVSDPVPPAPKPDVGLSTAIVHGAAWTAPIDALLHPSTDETGDVWLGTKHAGEIGSTEVADGNGPSTDDVIRGIPAATANETNSGPVSEFAEPFGAGQGAWVDPDQETALIRYQWRLGKELKLCIAETSPTTNCPQCTLGNEIALDVAFSADRVVQTGLPTAYFEYLPLRSCIKRRFGAVPNHGLVGTHSFRVQAEAASCGCE